MYGIIVLVVAVIFLIVFYKWCGDNKKQFYKVQFLIGILPFIWNLIYSSICMKNGFVLFDFAPVYGLEAFTTCFCVSFVFLFHIFIPAILAIIVSIVKLYKLKHSI